MSEQICRCCGETGPCDFRGSDDGEVGKRLCQFCGAENPRDCCKICDKFSCSSRECNDRFCNSGNFCARCDLKSGCNLSHSRPDVPLPHSRCSWLFPNIVLIGAVPNKETFPALERTVEIFVDLVGGSRPYAKELSAERYLQFPMPTGGVVEEGPTLEFINTLARLVEWKRRRIYIHCHGGFGRTTVIASLLLWKLMGINGEEAIKIVESLKEERQDKSRNFIPAPETNTQARFICKIAGGTAPDRSDREWLRGRTPRKRSQKNVKRSKNF